MSTTAEEQVQQSAGGAAGRGEAAEGERLLAHAHRGFDNLEHGLAHLWLVDRLEPLEPRE